MIMGNGRTQGCRVSEFLKVQSFWDQQLVLAAGAKMPQQIHCFVDWAKAKANRWLDFQNNHKWTQIHLSGHKFVFISINFEHDCIPEELNQHVCLFWNHLFITAEEKCTCAPFLFTGSEPMILTHNVFWNLRKGPPSLTSQTWLEACAGSILGQGMGGYKGEGRVETCWGGSRPHGLTQRLLIQNQVAPLQGYIPYRAGNKIPLHLRNFWQLHCSSPGTAGAQDCAMSY